MPFGRQLQVFALASFPRFSPGAANTTLVATKAGFGATLLALPIYWGEFVQQLGGRGMVPYLLVLLISVAVWCGLAVGRGWRRPPVALLLLVALQLTGSVYYWSSFRGPARVLNSKYTAFDFHVHTTHSSGLLTPQQQVNWHRARGFRGLAFTDSDRAMAPVELTALRAANPDMLLLNGCEYHGSNHILFIGVKNSISAHTLNPAAAIRAARRQRAVSVVAHPWWPIDLVAGQQTSGRGNSTGRPTSMEAYRRLGVDGFEAWNGVIWSRAVVQFVRLHHMLSTTATDTLSKSGSRCYTYTILPRGMDTESDVMRALRLHKVAAACALGAADTPAAYDLAQKRLRKPRGLFTAAHAAWRTLARAQKWACLLSLIAVGGLGWAWGAGSRRSGFELSGPQTAVGFLRKRRFTLRSVGLLVMAVAWAGSLLAAIYCFAWSERAHAGGLLPVHALYFWVGFDLIFLYGQSLWNNTP